MPYIGKSPHFGVRNRFIYTASADATSISGADANGATLTFTDGAYVDVYLNGILLKAGTDYVTTTANTIGSLSALASNDEVVVIVYDVFSVSDTVSATSGGTFVGNVTHSGTVTVDDTTDATSTTTGSIQTDGGLGVAKDVVIGDDLSLKSDSAVLNFGADNDVTVTHVADKGLIVTSGSSGATADTNVDELVVQGSGRSGISILTPDANDGQLVFGSPSDSIGAFISYKHATTTMGIGTSLANGLLTFNTADGSERMRINADGRVGIGDTGQSNTMTTITENSDTDITGLKVTTGATSYDGITLWCVQGDTSSTLASGILFGGYSNSAHKFFVRGDGDIETAGSTTVSGISDINFKENVVDANSQWDDIKALKVRNYSWKEDKLDKADKIGLIAQEAELVSPNLVFTRDKRNAIQYIKDENGKDIDNPDFGKKIDGETYKTLKYSVLYTKAVKALQEAMARIETLEAKVTALEDAD